MFSSRDKNSQWNFFGYFFMIVSLFIIIFAILAAFVLIVDQVDEWMAGWFYRNNWAPFKGELWTYPLQLPKALYNCFVHFPSSLFVSFLFFPLLIFAVPIFDVFYYRDFTFLIVVWAPFMFGLFLFIIAGLQAEQRGIKSKTSDGWH